MEALMTDGSIHSVLQRGIYTGMGQQLSAVEAEYFLQVSAIRVERQLLVIGTFLSRAGVARMR